MFLQVFNLTDWITKLTVGAKNEDMIASLRMGPPAPLQKSQEVITGKKLI